MVVAPATDDKRGEPVRTVPNNFEFFFVMTEDIGDMHKLIYVHQTRYSLCIHRLDEGGFEDELGVCATEMATVSEKQEIIDMYVCTNYIKHEG